MKTIAELKADANKLQAEAEAIMAIAKEGEVTEEQQARFDEIAGTSEKPGLIKNLREKMEQREAFDRDVAAIAARREAESRPDSVTPVIKVPARAKAGGALQAFRKEEDAYASGQWIYATMFGNKRAKAWCRDHGIKATMTTNENVAGGFLVPDALEATIIELREQYGVARRECQQITMGDAKMIMPKLSGEATTYYVGEGANITASDVNVTTVQLDARKLAAVTAVSSELNEDSIISVAEMIARSFAYKFALAEDQALFLGNGTSTYGGINGLANSIAAGSVVTATSNQTFGALTLANFESVIGKRKLWGGRPKWYVSQAGWGASMQRLANSAGGVTSAEIQGGVTNSFLGYEVVVSQVLESALTGTTTKRALYFGDLANGVFFGTRRGMSLAVDNSLGFLSDVIHLRATQRYDIVVHDTGDANESGGIVALTFG